MDTKPNNIVVVGGSGGIGRALVHELLNCFPFCRVYATYNRSEVPVHHDRLEWHHLDVSDPEQIEAFAAGFDRVDWIINCAGFLHNERSGPEKRIKSVDSDFLIENFKVNTIPSLLLARHFSVALKSSPAPLLAVVSARVGSIEDNRLGGWYSYRISKAALNMALKTLAIEWKHSHPGGCVVALHPGTNDTLLSRPFQANVAPQNLFDPAFTAKHFIKLLSSLSPDQSGEFRAWDGTTIPW